MKGYVRTVHTFILRQGWEGVERVERRELFALLRAHPDIHGAFGDGGGKLIHVCSLLLKEFI